MNKTVRAIIEIILALVIVGLIILIFRSVMAPVKFQNEKNFRYENTIQRLKDIRDAEGAYRTINKHYTADFDSLINFVKTGDLYIVKMVPDPTDTTFRRSILDTIGMVSVLDTIFKNRTDFNPDNMKYIPHSGGQIFKLEAGHVEKSKIQIPVFQCSALNKQILLGMDEQSIINEDAKLTVNDKFPGLMVGSMEEPSTDGNWE